MKERARQLRKRQTETEERLWYYLRNRRTKGMKFRRQHPIGPYIIDFYCSSAKLAVELDGGGHTEKLQKLHGQNRERFLASKGIKVMRFWDTEVWKELESVLREIRDRLPDNPSPIPRLRSGQVPLSPWKGERGKSELINK